MKKGPRLVIQGAILGSILIGSLCYFINAGAAPLDNQLPAPQNSQELSPTPTQPVNQENVLQAQPENADNLSPAQVVVQESQSQPQQTVDTLAPTKAVPAQPTKTQPAPAKPKKQKPACQVNDSYSERILQWCQLITQYANKYNLDPNLIAAVMLQESGGQSQAYSSSGAVGLMQIMPSDGLAVNFMCPAGPCFAKRPTIQELQDPEFNISYGTRMLASLLGKYGNIQDALKAYGPGNVGYYYVDKVMAIYNNYQ
jgi:soluble lytic murein transglycosylase-like protein